MEDKNYFYAGIGIVLLLTVTGGIGLVYSFSPPLNENVELSLRFSEEKAGFEFKALTSNEKLFSENGSILNFSPVQGKANLTQGIKCEISCKKEE